MRDTKLAGKLMKGVQAIWSSDFNIAITVAITVVIINAFIVAYNTGYVRGQERSDFLYGTYISGENFFESLNNIRLNITIAFLFAAAGLWLRRPIGSLLSSAALILIFLIYTQWYFDTKAYLTNSEVTEHTMLTDPFYKKMGLLHGATSWDWVVLIIAIVLFVWVIKTSVGAVLRRSAQKTSSLA